MSDKQKTKSVSDLIQVAGKSRDVMYCNILLYGQTGAGKSWMAATAPKPLVILTEANGYVSVAHSNPDALVVPVHSMDEIDTLLGMIRRGELQKTHEFDTLVLDSLTEMQRLMKSRLLRAANRRDMQLKDCGVLANEMFRYIRAIRDLPCHVVCTALQDSYLEEESGSRYVQPSFEGKKTVSVISQFFNAVGLLYKRQGEGDISQRLIMWDGPERIMCKPCHPLAGVDEDPNMSEIISRVCSVKQKKAVKKKPSLAG